MKHKIIIKNKNKNTHTHIYIYIIKLGLREEPERR